MGKQYFLIVLLLVIGLGVLYVLQSCFIGSEQLRPGFPTLGIYAFNLIFGLVLVLIMSFLASRPSFKERIGFMYLATVILKPIMFLLWFRNLFLDALPISKTEAAAMLLPTLLTLVFEVWYCTKILKD